MPIEFNERIANARAKIPRGANQSPLGASTLDGRRSYDSTLEITGLLAGNFALSLSACLVLLMLALLALSCKLPDDLIAGESGSVEITLGYVRGDALLHTWELRDAKELAELRGMKLQETTVNGPPAGQSRRDPVARLA